MEIMERRKYFDILKGMAIFFVVVGHASYLLSDYVYTYHLALFFFVSGFLYNEKKYGNDPFLNIGNRIKSNWSKYVIYTSLIGILHFFDSFQFICRIEGSKWDFSDYRNYFLNNIVMNNTEDLCGAMWFVPPLILASSLLGLIIYAGNTFGKYSKKHSILIKNTIIICLAGICLFLGNERMELKFMLDYRLDVSLFVIPLLVLAYFINTYVKDFSKYLKGYIAIPCFICTIYLAYKCGYRPLLAGQMVGIKSFYFYL